MVVAAVVHFVVVFVMMVWMAFMISLSMFGSSSGMVV